MARLTLEFLDLGYSQAPVKIRVCQVIDCLDPGGAGRVLVDLSNHLDREVFCPYVISTRAAGQLRTQLRSDVRFLALNRRSRFDLAAMRKMARFLVDNGIQLVHTHSHTTGYLCRLVGALGAHNWKHVFHDHNSGAVVRQDLAALDRLLLRGCAFYVCASQELCERAVREVGIPLRRCRYVPNGVEVRDHEPCREHNGRTVLHVANISRVKGHATSIRAAKIVSDRLRDVRWRLVGGPRAPSLMPGLRELVRELRLDDVVEFVGSVADARTEMASASVGILTSKREALPLALLEYLTSGLPVVATAVGQCCDVLEGSGAGFLVEPGRPEAVAAAVLDVLKDPELGDRMSLKAYQLAKCRFSIERFVHRMHSVYLQVLEG